MTARAIGLVNHPDRPQALELAATVTTVLAEHGIDVRTPDATRASTFADGLDVVVSLGGDGTMLRADWLPTRSQTVAIGLSIPTFRPLATHRAPHARRLERRGRRLRRAGDGARDHGRVRRPHGRGSR